MGGRGARSHRNAGDDVQRARSARRLAAPGPFRPAAVHPSWTAPRLVPSRYRRGVPSASLLRRVAVAPLAVLAVAVPAALRLERRRRGSRRDRPRTRARVPGGDRRPARATCARTRSPRAGRCSAPPIRRRSCASCSATGPARATSSPGSGTRSRRSPRPASKGRSDGAYIADDVRRRRRADWIDDQGGSTQEHKGVDIRMVADEAARTRSSPTRSSRAPSPR